MENLTELAKRLRPFLVSVAASTASDVTTELTEDFYAHQAATAAAGHTAGVGLHGHTNDAGGGTLDHGAALGGLGDDDHTQYLNVARHDLLERHTLGTVVPHDDHGLLSGLGDDDHTQYFRVDGTRGMSGSIIPTSTDTWDLGSSTLLWRKGWLSEMDAILFAKNTVTLVGGWLLVGPNEGALPADVLAAATSVDFGQAMTVGHFVLFRSALKVEYMQVGSLVSGTTYNVTRNLDGSGANDWPAGAPYSVLGTTGSGRIELNAYDTPRISIIEQGATYNAQTERVRFGDLTSWQAAGLVGYGWAAGSFAGNEYAYYSPSTGQVIRGTVRADDGWLTNLTVQGLLSLNTSGELRAGADANNGLRFGYLSDGYYLRGLNAGVTQFELRASDGRAYWGAGKGRMGAAGLDLLWEELASASVNWYDDNFATRVATIQVSPVPALGGPRLRMGVLSGGSFYESIAIDAPYGTQITNLKIRNGGTVQMYDTVAAGYVDVGLYRKLDTPLTSTSWDGDAYSSMGPTLIDLSAVFGVPAGVKAVSVRLSCRDSASATTNNIYVGLAPTNTAGAFAVGCSPRGLPNDWYNEQDSLCGCDANGDLYITVAASGAGTMDIDLRITGYCL